jgi:hypothetical protein
MKKSQTAKKPANKENAVRDMGYYATKSNNLKNIPPQQSRFETARKSE